MIGISEPELHEFVLTGRKCTFSGSWYPRGIAILGMLISNFSAGIVMSRKLNKFSSQRKVNLKARWGRKKTLGGILQGTLGVQKIIILDLPPGSGGRENGFYVKNGGKNDFSKK